MTESLLSFSEVLLFGRGLDDLKYEVEKEPEINKTVDIVAVKKVKFDEAITEIDDIDLEVGMTALIRGNGTAKNGIYTVIDNGGSKELDSDTRTEIQQAGLVAIKEGTDYEGTVWLQTKVQPKQAFKEVSKTQKKIGPGRGRGLNRHLAAQLDKNADPTFARIYGFAYEGTYYELPEPVIFLVDGPGKSATDGNLPTAMDGMGNEGTKQGARAPLDPSKTGVASADYQISNDIMYWPYDKADYTMRMDVMAGMFEQVLLDIYFGFDSPAISGAKVSGAKVSGAKVSGAKVSGAKVSGAKVSGAKARGSGD